MRDNVAAQLLRVLEEAGYRLDLSPIRPDPSLPAGLDPLAGMRLSAVERCAIQILLECRPRRLTLFPLREAMEARMGEPISEGSLRAVMARLTAPGVEILDSCLIAPNRGYQVTSDFLQEIAFRAGLRTA